MKYNAGFGDNFMHFLTGKYFRQMIFMKVISSETPSYQIFSIRRLTLCTCVANKVNRNLNFLG